MAGTQEGLDEFKIISLYIYKALALVLISP